MKALTIEKVGGVENFQLTEIAQPTASLTEILIQVKALSVNPVDFKVRANEDVLNMIYGESRPAILGWDIAGTVISTGKNTMHFKTGDKVFGMVNFPGRGNAYAEYVIAPENQLAKIPANISFEDAAATTLAALTALQVLATRIKNGDRVLIQGGAGGVGHFAIQIAKSLGAYVITTSSAKNKDFVMSLGADQHIDYHTQKFEEILSNIDFVFDMFNGEILLNSVKVVKKGGAIVSLPTPVFSEEILALAKERNVDVSQILVQSNGDDMNVLSTMLENGKIKPFVSKIFEFEDMAKAHLQLESGRTVGKVVVTI